MAEYSFQFYIDMGNSQIGSIFITNLSEPYVESSKFCAHYGLDPIVITVLGDSIREQMLIEEQECRLAQFQTENSKGDIDKSKSELRAIPLEEIDSAEMKPLRSSQNRLSNCRLGTKIQ